MNAGSEKFVAIGDIHGCKKTLEALLEKLAIYKDRVFVFVGDYIDRGPDSKGVVDVLIAFAAQHSCVFLQGNHEWMLLRAVLDGDFRMWQANGGQQTMKSYGLRMFGSNLPSQHYHFYKNTKLFYESEEYFFVHAGIPPWATIQESIADSEIQDEMMWTREHVTADETVWEKKVIFGHTPKPEPIVRKRMIGIDTGCVYRNLPDLGKLTAVLLPEESFIFQNCIDNPEPY